MAFQPKQFYRKLDRLLHEIQAGDRGPEWFAWLVKEIVERFGEELQIHDGRAYTEVDGGFRLEEDFGSDPNVKAHPPRRIRLGLIIDHGIYLFDSSVVGQDASLESRLGGLESAAILVESEPRRILAFGLRPGWDRVHLDFALNTLRHAIRQRLVVDDLQTDMSRAAEIQRSLLPKAPPPFPGFSIAARSIPAAQVGGDFYDFSLLQKDLMLLSLGDASGHELGSALLARDVVTGLRMGAERDLKIAAIMERLNRVISRSILSTRFVSLFLGELEGNGNLFYVNAGHPAPFLLGAQGVRKLTVGGLIIGPVEQATFKRGFAHVDRGDSLVIVSDGVLERLSPQGEEFGDEGLLRVVSPPRRASGERDPEALLAAASPLR
jgi:sigma-B regulation protein RsbU (phosphoserine phosphatase)